MLTEQRVQNILDKAKKLHPDIKMVLKASKSTSSFYLKFYYKGAIIHYRLSDHYTGKDVRGKLVGDNVSNETVYKTILHCCAWVKRKYMINLIEGVNKNDRKLKNRGRDKLSPLS